MPRQSPAYEAAKELLAYMVMRATDGGTVPTQAFREARETVLSDSVGAELAPECVWTCREPDNVWAYVKAQDPELGTYASRRAFFAKEFEPLLSALERFASAPLDSAATHKVEALDSGAVTAAWTKALDRRTTDPDGAITAARTLLESVCKTILDDIGIDYDPKDDLPKLYRATAKTLGLAPDEQSDEQIRRVLGGATTVVEGIGALRNTHGDAHGGGRSRYRLSGRHAALAVNLAGTMAMFLIETLEARAR